MYRVVIIDDEPIIVEGITRMIPWNQYNSQVVATAGDGIEGTEIIRKYQPHIIISDIAMPGLNGLNMVAGIKSEFPKLEISILTGYRDFDYARSAIKLGVTRYLLKPSNMDELKEAIFTMTENLKNNNIFPNKSDKGELDIISDSTASCFIVNNAIKYMEDNYKHKLTLSEVADNIYVSQWHLSKLLNRNMGQNFSEILNNIRIEQAKLLLKDPSLRIGEIAELVGFMEVAHFSRVFKKTTGISANEYRNKI